jgi:transcriptional regulator with XRE-family HTH domain
MTKEVDSGRRFFLRQHRQLRGFTQNQIADALFTDKSVVSQLETGAARYNDGWVDRLCFLFDLEPHELFLPPGAKLVPVEGDELLERILRAWPKLEDADRSILVGLCERLERDAAD